MKIGKLKKKTVKELEHLGIQIERMRDKMSNRFDKMLMQLDEAIGHIETLNAEKENKKIKPIKMKEGVTYVSDTTVKNKKAKKA